MVGLFVGSHLSVWTFPKKREKYNHSFPVNDFDILGKIYFPELLLECNFRCSKWYKVDSSKVEYNVFVCCFLFVIDHETWVMM